MLQYFTLSLEGRPRGAQQDDCALHMTHLAFVHLDPQAQQA